MRTMLVTLLAVLMGLLAHPAQAQQPLRHRADQTYIVTAGDSTVAGAGTVSRRFGWPGRLHRRNMREIDLDNVGRSASCLVATGCGYGKRLLDTFDEEVLAKHPDVVIVGVGRNDLCHVGTEEYIAAAQTLLTKSAAAGVELRFGTITPPNEKWQWPCEEQAAEINTWLRTLPGTIDFAAAVSDKAGVLRHRYDHGDGLHPNGRGYQAMAKAAEAALGLR